MTNWSKMYPKIERMSCSSLIHPNTENCLLAAAYIGLDSAVGSAGYFFLLHLCRFVSKALKKKKKVELKDFLRTVLRSTIFGAVISSTTVGAHCLLRKLIGKYYIPTLVLIPSVVGGFAIYVETQRLREFYTNVFGNCTMELWLKYLERSKILRWNSNIQTALFMVFSSLASFLLSSTNFNANYFWFFMPPKVTTNEEKKQGECFHEGSCRKNILNLLITYSSTGFILQFLRLFFGNLKNPAAILSGLGKPRTFRLAAFLGSYAVTYQAIRCFLYRKEKKYSSIHDSIAGFLAGLTFRFQPTIAIFNSAVITTLQIFTEFACQKKILPNIPYLEMLFTLFCGLLFHYRILSDSCPGLAIYFMSGVTHGFTDRLYNTFKTIQRELGI